ncbi:hypothetical protein OESDEN_20089, partial [Oesophagostomum dentatum]
MPMSQVHRRISRSSSISTRSCYFCCGCILEHGRRRRAMASLKLVP